MYLSIGFNFCLTSVASQLEQLAFSMTRCSKDVTLYGRGRLLIANCVQAPVRLSNRNDSALCAKYEHLQCSCVIFAPNFAPVSIIMAVL